MKTEDGHASFQGGRDAVGKVGTALQPVTRIIGHGILDLPMIRKYVRAGTYLPGTSPRRWGGGARGACPGMKHPGLRPGALPGRGTGGPTRRRGRRPGRGVAGAGVLRSDAACVVVFSFPDRPPPTCDAAAVDVCYGNAVWDISYSVKHLAVFVKLGAAVGAACVRSRVGALKVYLKPTQSPRPRRGCPPPALVRIVVGKHSAKMSLHLEKLMGPEIRTEEQLELARQQNWRSRRGREPDAESVTAGGRPLALDA